MPTTKAHKTRHHSNLRPKHKHNKRYLQTYWPYLPLMAILVLIVTILQPWHTKLVGGKVLPYATSMSTTQLLQETNTQRKKYGQKELQLNQMLSSAAQTKAQDMVSKNYWSHTTPGGDMPWLFINESGYQYSKAGENLAYGFVTSNQVISGWMNSPTHRANILDNGYQHVGFGFADSANFDNNGPTTVVVAMYGAPLITAYDSEELKPTTLSPGTFSTTNPQANPQSTYISKIQLFTKGLTPWANYVAAMLTGASLMYLLIKHGLGLKRWAHKGERFIIQHPVLDATIFSLGLLGLVISQKIGVIL